MFRELDNEGRILRMENYAENNGVSSGYAAFLHAKKKIHSSLFSPTNTNSIFMIVGVDDDSVDKNVLQSEKMKGLLGKYIKASDENCASFDVIDDRFEDKDTWIPSFEDGFVSIQEKKGSIEFKGAGKYIIMAYATYPVLSKQFYQYLQKNIDDNNVTTKDFMENDMAYKKFLDLAFRNIQKLIYNFSVLIGVTIDTISDIGEFIKTSHNAPSLLAVPLYHWWINTLAKTKYTEYVYNNNTVINPLLLEPSENDLFGVKLYNEVDINKMNECIIYPFLSGVSNKILFVRCSDVNEKGFPFYGLKIEGKDEDSDYSIKHIKNIEKSFVVRREHFELESEDQFTNYEELFGYNRKYEEIYFVPVILIVK